jgi:hypothetical protein
MVLVQHQTLHVVYACMLVSVAWCYVVLCCTRETPEPVFELPRDVQEQARLECHVLL